MVKLKASHALKAEADAIKAANEAAIALKIATIKAARKVAIIYFFS